MEGECETGCGVDKEQKEEEDTEGKNPPPDERMGPHAGEGSGKEEGHLLKK